MRMEVKNLFSGLPDELPRELFDTIVERGAFRLERIVSRGHVTPDGQWYDQPRPEWVVVLRGSARLEFAGDIRPVLLGAGDHLVIPAHCRHRVVCTAPGEDTVWLALHFD